VLDLKFSIMTTLTVTSDELSFVEERLKAGGIPKLNEREE